MKHYPTIIAPGAAGSVGVVGPPGEQGSPGPPCAPGTPAISGGTTYVRWGRTVCPNVTGTELVYEGLTAGSHFTHQGGAANYICTVAGADVEYFTEATTANEGHSVLAGAEYEVFGQALNSNGHDLLHHNVPCAVCEVSSCSKQIMIPGRYTCPDTWTVEYNGWLMAERNNHYRTMYFCMDKTPEVVNGTAVDTNGALVYHVEADCGVGLPCPNYNETKELSCAVCTK